MLPRPTAQLASNPQPGQRWELQAVARGGQSPIRQQPEEAAEGVRPEDLLKVLGPSQVVWVPEVLPVLPGLLSADEVRLEFNRSLVRQY